MEQSDKAFRRIAEMIELGSTPKIASQMVEKIIAIRRKQIDDFVCQELYSAYKDLGISNIFVISMDNFEKFLKKYLPIYYKEAGLDESKTN